MARSSRATGCRQLWLYTVASRECTGNMASGKASDVVVNHPPGDLVDFE